MLKQVGIVLLGLLNSIANKISEALESFAVKYPEAEEGWTKLKSNKCWCNFANFLERGILFEFLLLLPTEEIENANDEQWEWNEQISCPMHPKSSHGDVKDC